MAKTNSGQGRDRIEPMLETLLKSLVETPPHPKATTHTEDTITAALIEALIAPSPEHTASLDITTLAVILAPALADALAPALADALVPALVKALNTLISTKKTGQESSAKNGSD